MKLLAMAMLTMLAACASAPSAAPEPQTITYTRGPCFGVCPVYRVMVSADGSGLFEGERFTAVTGQRRFTVTPEAFRAFAAKLAPHRPQGTLEINMGHARCQMQATDQPSAIVSWAGGGRNDRLGYYYGCRDEANSALAQALTEAPALLPIASMIGAPR